jgi:hypothetical protein
VRVQSEEYREAKTFCGVTVAKRTWVASISFMHPPNVKGGPVSTASNDTELFLVKVASGWRVWYEPQQV